MVRYRKGVQRASHGPPGTQPRRPLQLLFSEVYHENCADVGGPGNLNFEAWSLTRCWSGLTIGGVTGLLSSYSLRKDDRKD